MAHAPISSYFANNASANNASAKRTKITDTETRYRLVYHKERILTLLEQDSFLKSHYSTDASTKVLREVFLQAGPKGRPDATIPEIHRRYKKHFQDVQLLLLNDLKFGSLQPYPKLAKQHKAECDTAQFIYSNIGPIIKDLFYRGFIERANDGVIYVLHNDVYLPLVVCEIVKLFIMETAVERLIRVARDDYAQHSNELPEQSPLFLEAQKLKRWRGILTYSDIRQDDYSNQLKRLKQWQDATYVPSHDVDVAVQILIDDSDDGIHVSGFFSNIQVLILVETGSFGRTPVMQLDGILKEFKHLRYAELTFELTDDDDHRLNPREWRRAYYDVDCTACAKCKACQSANNESGPAWHWYA